MVSGGLEDAVVENVRPQSLGQKPREVGAVVGVPARPVANHRHSTRGARARHVVGEIEVQGLGDQRATSRSCFSGGGADCYNLEWPGPIERELRFEDLGVSARFGPLPDGSGGVVGPHPATDDVDGELPEPIGQRRVATFDAGYVEGVLFAG